MKGITGTMRAEEALAARARVEQCPLTAVGHRLRAISASFGREVAGCVKKECVELGERLRKEDAPVLRTRDIKPVLGPEFRPDLVHKATFAANDLDNVV